MNDERNELVAKVISELEDAPDSDYPSSDYEEVMVKTATKIIALVTAARDAEIRELLLSDGAKNASAHRMQELSAQGVWRNHTLAFYGMKAALEHIGLQYDGTGGQG